MKFTSTIKQIPDTQINTKPIHELIILNSIPLIKAKSLPIPNHIPSCCGPGHDWIEKIIPESILGLKISIACFIHDDDWTIAPPTWQAFHAANSRLLTNLNSIIDTKSIFFLRPIRKFIASLYFIAVNDASEHFWIIKRGQTWKTYTFPEGV